MSGIKNKYSIEGDIVKILLESKYGNYYTILDLDDFNNKIKNITAKWNIRGKEDLYAQRTFGVGKIDGVYHNNTQNMHFLIINCPKGMFIDHINHNTLDNRKCNLRVISCQENDTHRKGANKNNKSGYRNVFWNSAIGKWSVNICKNYQHMHIGDFDDVNEAGRAAEEARKKYFGKFSGNG